MTPRLLLSLLVSSDLNETHRIHLGKETGPLVSATVKSRSLWAKEKSEENRNIHKKPYQSNMHTEYRSISKMTQKDVTAATSSKFAFAIVTSSSTLVVVHTAIDATREP
ncbi:hypothetical protein VNO77_04798 [Canavalia gladiata]|uniref:Uncharacterized protein n=1 Tax=Canavalia gladiata TaxID=3824 RepID=A0AAN9N3P1_CANGL